MEALLAGHYQIIKHLGGGGFGQTFLARDNHLPGNPWWVVKQLKPQFNEPGTLTTAKRLFNSERELYAHSRSD
jgi:serine/threonine protein kinase